MTNLTEEFRTLINIRSVGAETVVNDFLDIPGVPGAGTLTYRTTELPLNVITAPSVTEPVVVRQVDPTTHVHNAGAPDFHAVYTLISAGTPIADQFLVESSPTFGFGLIDLSQFNGGDTVEVIYTGRGSLVFAEDVNELADGTLIQDGKIIPRHISTDIADDYTFPNDVIINGDLNVAGVVNKVASEVLDLTDDILFMNQEYSGALGSGPDMGFELNRGDGQAAVTNPTLSWNEATDKWEFTAQTASVLFDLGTTAASFSVPVTFSSIIVTVLGSDPGSPAQGQVWLNTTDGQFKGYDGSAVILLG